QKARESFRTSCADAADWRECRLRRARIASRPKLSRRAVRGSGKPVGRVDESETGSANFCAHFRPIRKNFAKSERIFSHVLRGRGRLERVPLAPSADRKQAEGGPGGPTRQRR